LRRTALATALILSFVGSSARADYTPAAGAQAGEQLMRLDLIRGKYPGDPLALTENATRAELISLIVRAMHREERAAALQGYPAYPDTADHWASGEIALAQRLLRWSTADPLADAQGRFRPDDPLTPVEALQILMLLIDLQPESKTPYPANYLNIAVAEGLITEQDRAMIQSDPEQPASRSMLFYLADRAFGSDRGSNGSYYRTYFDTAAPFLTLDGPTSPVGSPSVRITGRTESGAMLFVGERQIPVEPTGDFSFDVALPAATTYTIQATARDLVGNEITRSVQVTRTGGPPVSLTAEGPVILPAGSTASVPLTILDEEGTLLPHAPTSGTSDLGRYREGRFTAGEKAGNGTLTVRTGALETTVAVQVVLASPATLSLERAHTLVNQPLPLIVRATDPFGNSEQVTTGLTFASQSPDVTITTDGTFTASQSGSYPVTISYTGPGGPVTQRLKVRVLLGPSLESLPPTSHRLGDWVRIQAVVTNPDGEALTFGATGLPQGLAINPATGEITGYADGATGVYQPTVTVTSTSGYSASQGFEFTVLDRPAPPIPKLAPQYITVALGETPLPVSVKGALNYQLLPAQSYLPDGLTLNPDGSFSGVINALPVEEDLFIATVLVTLPDGLRILPVGIFVLK